MKLAIVVGHNAKSQGAVRVTDGRTEFDWNTDLAHAIKAQAPQEVRIFNRTKGGGYSGEIDRVYGEVDEWGADASIELHFNAAGSPQARGVETLCSGSNGSIQLCSVLQAAMHGVLGGMNRGVKVVKKSDRGGRSLHAGRAPAALIEPYFGSHAASCRIADEKMEELARVLFTAAKTTHG